MWDPRSHTGSQSSAKGKPLIISHKYRFIFVKTQKTAGTSIEWYLNRLLGPDDIATPVIPPIEGFVARHHRGLFNPVPEVVRRGPRALPRTVRDLALMRRYYNHLPAYRIKARVGLEVWDSYLTFCVERNPWDKSVSYFSMKDARADAPLAWEDFLAGDDHCHNLTLYTDPRDRTVPMVDRVLRYESLRDELDEVFTELGVPFEGELTNRAKSGYRTDSRPYVEWYDDDQQARIAQVFADEIVMHGYTFGSPPKP